MNINFDIAVTLSNYKSEHDLCVILLYYCMCKHSTSNYCRVSCAMDARIPNCGTFTLFLEDHTMGALIQQQLLTDESVIFASYRAPHPLENKIEIRARNNILIAILHYLFVFCMMK